MSLILNTCASGFLLCSGAGVPSWLFLWMSEAEQEHHPSSHAPPPAPCTLPYLQSAVSAGHLQVEFFWQETLVALSDQLAPLLGSVAISGAAEAAALVGVDICSDDRLPAPPYASDFLSP